MKLSDKEAVGVYLLMLEREYPLDETMARLMKRIEDSIYRKLTVAEVQDLQSVYRSMDDTPEADLER